MNMKNKGTVSNFPSILIKTLWIQVKIVKMSLQGGEANGRRNLDSACKEELIEQKQQKVSRQGEAWYGMALQNENPK